MGILLLYFEMQIVGKSRINTDERLKPLSSLLQHWFIGGR